MTSIMRLLYSLIRQLKDAPCTTLAGKQGLDLTIQNQTERIGEHRVPVT
jgi:hypothetical protein